ncbi:YopD family type III secretion system translocon subunit [Aeromonas schubertii]|uniref:YopD family type III secretion system translocon subunit n=1 Tax=Aeromonas schubertii TaxID=652 RepID=A0ABS7VBE5_9GAMM|nr:YopD family type III secretion system translocon subunit [Aeromonas schubertii]MBZ6066710.1 YopD family type III secretion system translocon subunit [Aeromonas schubertii]
MNGINNDYSVNTGYVPAAGNDGVDGSQGAARANTTHEAGNSQGASTPAPQSRPELIRPNQGLDVSLLTKGSKELDSTLSIMSLLFEMARRAREMGLLQRDMENQAVISAQKDQVNEMRSGAKLMIAMAVVSGVMTGISAIMGGFSMSKSAKAIKQDKALNANMAGRQKELNQTGDIKKAAGLEMGDAGNDLMGRIKSDKAALKTLNKKFEANNGRQQLFSTVIQGGTQMANSAVQLHQGYSQADAKEDEVRSSVAQTQKQKVEDQMNFQNSFMKDVLQMMQQYAQSHNQAMRAAFGVA